MDCFDPFFMSFSLVICMLYTGKVISYLVLSESSSILYSVKCFYVYILNVLAIPSSF